MSGVRATVGILLLVSSAAQAQTPSGPEFRVSTDTTVDHYFNDVSADANGNFVVVWTRGGAIVGQRFDVRGVRRGAEFLVTSYTTASSGFPRVNADTSGGFAVAWVDFTGNRPQVMGRRFDAGGNPVAPEVRVNSYTTYAAYIADVSSDPAGNWVVVWTSVGQDDDSYDIRGQRFGANGARVGAEFVVNTYTTGIQWMPSVASDASGNFVVVWGSHSDPVQGTVLGQRFSGTGGRLGGELQISAGTIGVQQRSPGLAVSPAGDFVVVWHQRATYPPRIEARQFDATGSPVGPQFIVHNLGPYVTVSAATVAMDDAGAFTVVWDEYPSRAGELFEIWGRHVDPTGTPLGPAFAVNSTTTGYQNYPRVSRDPVGHVVVTWSSAIPGSNRDIYAQRFGLLGAAALAVDPTAGGSSDGNGVLEPGEAADMKPSWTNNAATAESLDGVLSALTGPPGPAYTIVDGVGSYGSVAAGGTRLCLDCYRVGVSAASRPALHWDANVRETINASDEGHLKWMLHIGDSFVDVPRSSPFYRFVETLLHRGVTSGCGGAAYCPSSTTTREQMSVFLLVAKEGAGYLPSVCTTPVFGDVPASSPFCRFIEELARRGVVAGCGAGNYCPNDPVTREQMAVFLLRTLDPTLSPPACTTPMFGDVPASSAFCRWVEELARRGITAGCGGGNYCPGQPVTREQMAVFLTTTFGLTLYGP